ARVDGQWDVAAVARGQRALDDLVWSRDERGHVAGEHGGGREGPGLRFAVVDGGRSERVADDAPGGRGGHRELERRLEVGLLEDGEHATAVRDLELGVQVHLVVD